MNGFIKHGSWSWRGYLEFAGTTCDVLKNEIYNCAYNHSIYQTGYRYRGYVIGHGADNDAKLATLGVVLVNDSDTQWRALIRSGTLNDGGPPDPYNSLTPTATGSLEYRHRLQPRVPVWGHRGQRGL